MLTIERKGPGRIDVSVAGRIGTLEMEAGLERLIAETGDMSAADMLTRVSGRAWPSVGALTVKLRKLPELLALRRRFRRVALVADAGWLRSAAELEGALLPGIQVRGFRPADAGAAEDWLRS
ncbi:MAG: STAS/SEC14 domain-containing protein [Pseudomonadota bacterium]